MNGTSLARGVTAVALAAATALTPSAHASRGPDQGEPVVARGGYLGAGCVPTALSASGDGAFTCRGESTYTGYFTTVNPFVVTGTLVFDAATGQVTATGTVEEWHHGRAADGSVGSMRTFQTFTQHADGTGTFTGCVVEAHGDWERATGTLTADGWQGVAAVGAHGSYRFLWDREGDRRSRTACVRRMAAAKRAGAPRA